ncbi:MAG TPA: response regulator [Bacteroidota bacterium]|nr:response regulator [Bacteroidota bacterium]
MSTRQEILIAEDEPVQAMKLQFVLEQAGYRATIAGNGASALAAMAGSPPALLITDINMPVMDGWELCRRVRRNDDLAQTPIIILTSQSDPTDILNGLAVGADSFVTKPYENEAIKTRVKHVLAGGRHPRTQEENITVAYKGREYVITASRFQMLGFFLATYEMLAQREFDLLSAQEELNAMNASLEQMVQDRTAALTEQIAEKERVEARLREQAASQGPSRR